MLNHLLGKLKEFIFAGENKVSILNCVSNFLNLDKHLPPPPFSLANP